MHRIPRFLVPRHVRRGGDDLLATYHRGLAQHWHGWRHVRAAALRGGYALSSGWQLRKRDDLRWRDLGLCWEYGLLPRELAAALRDLPGQPLDAVVSAHDARGIHQLVNPGAWPIRDNLLLDKARWARAMAGTGLPLPPTFGPGEPVPDWARHADALIVKPGFHNQGRGIRRWERGGDEPIDVLARELRAGGVVQKFLRAHESMADRSPGALPTVRVITVLDADDAPEAATAVVRMGGGGSILDNFHAGGVAAAIDLETGRTVRAATMETGLRLRPLERHPASGAELIGFFVPFLAQVLEVARAAHRATARHGFEVVGWDVGLSEDGPVLIEGNWNPGTPVSQYVTGRALGTSRLGALMVERLRRVPPERWRTASVLAWSSRPA